MLRTLLTATILAVATASLSQTFEFFNNFYYKNSITLSLDAGYTTSYLHGASATPRDKA